MTGLKLLPNDDDNTAAADNDANVCQGSSIV
jgi:hypothetical protein